MSKTLSVSAIKEGTVIDHIPPKNAFRIIQMLKLMDKQLTVTVGLNLSSHSMKMKDLIKIENFYLTKEEENQITIFAHDATINIIENFKVARKVIPHLPKKIVGVFNCLNPTCITQNEKVETYFFVEEEGKKVKLQCKYCEKKFDRQYSQVRL